MIQTNHTLFPKLLWMCLLGVAAQASAEKIYYALNDVWFLKEGSTTNLQQMHGYFSWTYTAGDFENGTGVFHYLDIPGTAHDHTDLLATIEPSSIEITLDANVHDDGVDITLKLLTPFSPTGTAVINTVADPAVSKFDIGGNGFYSGTIYSGNVAPFEFELDIQQSSPTTVDISWAPAYSGPILQQSSSLNPPSWSDAAAGNPLNANTTAPKMFYKLVLP